MDIELNYIHDVDKVEHISKTIFHGYAQSDLVHGLEKNVIQISHSKRFKPLWIFQYKLFEEQKFQTLLYVSSQPSDFLNHFYYQEITQWELLDDYNEFATHLTNIFFKSIQILINQFSSITSTYVCKGEIK